MDLHKILVIENNQLDIPISYCPVGNYGAFFILLLYFLLCLTFVVSLTKKKAVSRRLFFHGISLFDFLRYKKDCVMSIQSQLRTQLISTAKVLLSAQLGKSKFMLCNTFLNLFALKNV